MACLSSKRKERSTKIVVLATLFLLVFSLQEFSPSFPAVADSSEARLDTVSSKRTAARTNSRVESVEDLFKNFSSNVSRLSAAYDLIGDANEAELIELFDQVINRKYAPGEESSKSSLISLISTQLANTNLEETVTLYKSQPFNNGKHMLFGLMHAWTNEDFDSAVTFARNLDETIQSVALRGIVEASPNLPESTLLNLGAELGDMGYVERALAIRQMETDLADPDKAWTRLINDPKIDFEEHFNQVNLVAHALIDKYGVYEFDDLLSSLSSPKLNFGLRKSILSTVALRDPETAFNLALETPHDVLGTMLLTVINTWATTDPQSALSRVSLLEPSRVRDRLQQKVVSFWVQLTPEKFVDSFESIPAELHDTAQLSLVRQLSQHSIDDAIELLFEIQNVTTQEKAATVIVDSWINENPYEAFEWVLSNPKIDQYRYSLVSTFLTKFSEQDAEKAFDLALRQPIDQETGIGLEATVIDTLIYSHTDYALSLLNRVRPGTTRLAAFESVSTGLISGQRTEEALELGKRLSDKEQVNYYNNAALHIATRESPSRILELISNVPIEESRSKIAKFALDMHIFFENKELYSAEDVQTLLEHVEPAELQHTRLLLQR